MAPALDHILPDWAGGGDEIDYLQASHQWCNGARVNVLTWESDEVIRAEAWRRSPIGLMIRDGYHHDECLGGVRPRLPISKSREISIR
ncbi:hypothetical protein [Diaminobutyricimonas sp. LJ205]|uniref:hypothetical protein n=1 Tax=Diaminobutyricimonas sp. LJ205 TaxID=2683590 RepID=UPI0012F48391|nr:hypothetical protein [Diaminobutyricimonas sp. LJ205]